MNFFGVIERAAAPFLATFIQDDVRRRSNVQREPDIGKTSRNVSMGVPLTFILPHKWSVSVGYENKTDFENDNYVTNRAKIGIGKELESAPLSFYLQAKRDFDSGEKEFQVNFVVTYFFR
jgi:hypothetical protein